ncbi:hypothetical protein CRG98_042253 [Punica granatum]|uniref:Retrotransposon gag domain-containing protein n=1 Tax=Punica granatum TaxID=22663 RepID=A0A2I0I1L9_PUNGR|nr:hypothetical protein CRG98_042253 [Punica granatum]
MTNEAIYNHPNAKEQEVEVIQALEQRIERMERTLEQRLEQKLDQMFEELRIMLGALNLHADQNAGDGDSDEESGVACNRFAHQRGNKANRQDDRDFRLKVDIPVFIGCLDIEEFLDWLSKVNWFFEYTKLPEEKHRCVQGLRSVHDYTIEFFRLAECNALNKLESQQVARYVEGLKPTSRDEVGVQIVATVGDAQSLAFKAEMMQNKENSYRRSLCKIITNLSGKKPSY